MLLLITFSATQILGKNPLEEVSARRRDLYLYDTQHSQETDIDAPPAGLEPSIAPSERPQRHALNSEAIVIGQF